MVSEQIDFSNPATFTTPGGIARLRALLADLRARRAARDIQSVANSVTQPSLSPSLEPRLTPQAAARVEQQRAESELDIGGFPGSGIIENVLGSRGVQGLISNIQKATETSAGVLASSPLQPGGLLPNPLALAGSRSNVDRLRSERGITPFNVAGQAQAFAEGFRQTDFPSATVSLPFTVGLPGDATLKDIDVGVKGAVELLTDPTNVIGASLITRPGRHAVRAGTKAAAAGAKALPENVRAQVSTSISELTESARQLRNNLRGNLPPPIPETLEGIQHIPNSTSLPPPGVRLTPRMVIRPSSIAEMNANFAASQAKTPQWVKSLRDSNKRWVGPLVYGLDKINPSAFVNPHNKLSVARLFHIQQATESPTLVQGSVIPLVAPKVLDRQFANGFKTVKSADDQVDAVFKIDGAGRILNLAIDIADDNPNARHFTNILENAFTDDDRLRTAFGDEFTIAGKTGKFPEFNEEEILTGIREGVFTREFAEQATHIVQVQDYFREIHAMLNEFGVDVKQVKLLPGQAYISRIVKAINGIEKASASRRPTAKQPQEFTRTLLEDDILKGMERVTYSSDPREVFELALESAYQMVRDTQLEALLRSEATLTREAFLGPLQRAAASAAREVEKAESAIEYLKQAERGAKLPGAQTAAIRRLGQDFAEKFNDVQALKGQRRREALREMRSMARSQYDEAMQVRKLIRDVQVSANRRATGDTAGEVFQRMGMAPGQITDSFRWAYPEVALELQHLWNNARQTASAPVRRTRGKQTLAQQVDELRRIGSGDNLLREIDEAIALDDAAKRTARLNRLRKRAESTLKAAQASEIKVREADKKRLTRAINNDVKEIVGVAKRVDDISKIVGRTEGKLIGAERQFLAKYGGDDLLAKIDEAVALDDAAARKAGLKEIRESVEKMLEAKRALSADVKGKLRGKTKQLDNLRVAVKSGKVDPVTGRHTPVIVDNNLELLFETAEQGSTGHSLVLKEAVAEFPSLRGLYFFEDEVKQLERLIQPGARRNPRGRDYLEGMFLQVVPAGADILRVVKAGFDFGAPFLQGIPILARRPDVWAKATGRHFKAWFDNGQAHTLYLSENIDSVRDMIAHGVPVSGAATDYFLAIQRGGTLRRVGEGIDRKVLGGDPVSRGLRKAGRTIESGALRFEASFTSFGDYARVEMWKALRDTAAKKGDEGLNDLGALIRNMTGALPSGSIGVLPSQQALERGWLMFSPRYTRASLALVADAFQGGLRGQQARQTFAQMIAGGAAMYAGMVTLINAAGGDQKMHLDPRPKALGGDGAEFMTIDIAGQNIGIGSFWTGFVRLIAGTAGSAIDDPEVLVKPSVRDNPILRWMRGRSAPPGANAIDIASGTDFLGRDLDLGANLSTANHFGRQTLPFVLENLAYEDGPLGGRFMGAGAEVFGSRTFPISVIEQRNAEREISAHARFGKKWDELNGLQKKSLENDPALPLAELTVLAREEFSKVESDDPDSLDFQLQKFFKRRSEADEDWRAEMSNALELFDRGVIDTVMLKELWLEPANRERRLKVADLNDSDEFAEVVRFFTQLAERGGPVTPEDEAYAEYIENIVIGDFELPNGRFDYRAQEAAEKVFTDHWGEEMAVFIRERFNANRETPDFQFPTLVEELYNGRIRFAYYWKDIDDQLIQRSRNPEELQRLYDQWYNATDTDRKWLVENSRTLSDFFSQSSKVRRILRERNAELDAFMFRWGFSDTLVHRDNAGTENYWRYTGPMQFPLPVQVGVQ